MASAWRAWLVVSGGWGGGGGNWGGNSRVVLYASNFSGRSTVSTDVLSNLGNTGFNDRASSIRVERGYWLFCSDANFMGECLTFGPGHYRDPVGALQSRSIRTPNLERLPR